MESKVAVIALTALGHEGRLAVFRLLARRAPEGVRPSEIAEALGMKRNTLSVHVSTLERAGLVTSRREGKSVFYGIDLAATGALVGYLAADCCRGRPEVCAPAALPFLNPTGAEPMSDRVWNVLFICTGNSARSIFAEAIMTKLGRGRFRAYSAGTRPFSEINPKTLHVLKVHGHDVSDLRSKNIGEFAASDAPHMDFVFTVCDGAANEECPPLPGQPVSGHWGVPDPVVAETEPGNANLAFQRAYGMLERRISIFLSTPLERLERTAIQQHVDEIAALPDTGDAQEGAA